MGLILRNMSASAGAPRVNLSGSLYFDHGTTAGAGGGGYVVFPEVASVGNPAANSGSLYVADNSTVTTLYFKDSAGTATNLLAGASSQVAGSNTMVQYNNNGAFGGADNLLFDGTNVTIGGADTDAKLLFGDGGQYINSAADTQLDLVANGNINLTSTGDEAAAIYLRANGGTSETVKIHSDQGTSVAEGAASVSLLSDAGGVELRSTANLVNAINITNDGGTTGTIMVFNDQGTSALEGAASVQLLTDAGGIGIKSAANLAGAVRITADGGAAETIIVHADQSTVEGANDAGAIQLIADAGGVSINAAADKDIYVAGGQVNITGEHNTASTIYLRANAGTSETIKIHADQGTSAAEGAASVSLLSDAGGVELRSTANLANAVNLTVDGGTTSTMTLFNDTGTSVTDGAASVQLLSDAGGIGIKSTANLANAVYVHANGGTSETIKVHADLSTVDGAAGAGAIELTADAGGISLNAAAGKDIWAEAGRVILTANENAASAIKIHADAGAAQTIVLVNDAGTTANAIDIDATWGGVDIDGYEGVVVGGTVATSVTIGRSGKPTWILGDLFVSGTTTAVSSSNLAVKDPVIALNVASGSAAGNDPDKLYPGPAGDIGMVMPMTGAYAGSPVFFWDHSSFSSGVPQGNFSLSYANTTGSSGVGEAITPLGFLDLKCGNITVPNDSGIGSAGDTNAITISAAGQVDVTATTEATSATDGALAVAGGLSVANSVVIGNDLDLLSDGAILNIGSTSKFTLTAVDSNNAVQASSGHRLAFGDAGEYIAGDGTDLKIVSSGDVDITGDTDVVGGVSSTQATVLASAAGTTTIGSTTAAVFTAAGLLNVNNATDATTNADGSLQTDGGLSVAKAIFNSTAATLAAASGVVTIGSSTAATFSAAGLLNVNNATEATSATDGSLQTDGGLSVVKSAVIGDDLDLLSDGAILSIGSTSKFVLTDQSANNAVMAASGARLAFGNAGEYISGDGTDLKIVSSNDIDVTGDLDVVGGVTSTLVSTLASASGVTTIGSTTALVVSAAGAVAVNNATDSTAGTNGSLQTDGGLGVVKDIIAGNDVKLLTDSAVLSLGLGSDATLTHDGTSGLTVAATPISINSTGDLTLDSSTDIVLDAAGGNFEFKDAGVLQMTIDVDAAAQVTLKTEVADESLEFKVMDDPGGSLTLLELDPDASVGSIGDIKLGYAAMQAGHVAMYPVVDNVMDLGGASNRFRNIYTGDLHLANDRGNWTVVEEEDMLTIRNNKSGKWYRMAMEEIDPSGRDEGMNGAPPVAGGIDWEI